MLWFVLHDQEISGPFAKDHILSNFDEKALIWGPGLDECSDKNTFQAHLLKPKTTQEAPVSIVPQANTSVAAEAVVVEEPTKPEVKASEVIEEEPPAESLETQTKWYYACNKEKFGPFAEEELVQMLQMLNFSSQVYLWNKSLDSWSKLEDFPEIILQVTDSSSKTAA
ncbi:MAG: DUF4339 domain-containing protein [Bdellovibrionales bacterium]